MTLRSSRRRGGRRLSTVLGLVLVIAAAAASPAGAATAPSPALKVMTRNIYLGADLTPGLQAANLSELADASAVILRQVDANKFGVRSRGLSEEILKKQPDLVGLQEVALWRTGPCDKVPIPPIATHVRYDFLKQLLGRLNAGGVGRYRAVVTKPEFDFETYVDWDHNDATHGPGCPLGAEFDARLTMRDVILRRADATARKVTTSNPKSGTFNTLLRVKVGGAVDVDVTRGWTAVDAQVGGGTKFRFVNTHLEAFDSQASNHTNHDTDVPRGAIRGAQARELFAKGGPATGPLPVVLLGDLNSDKATQVQPGDARAYNALLGAGFVERSTSNPLSCCLDSALLTSDGGGSIADFDHKVDHIMTNRPAGVRLVSSAVSGRKPKNGFWDSDHAGLFSALTLP